MRQRIASLGWLSWRTIDVINYTIAHANRAVEEAHYYLASLPLQDNRPLMDQANFHFTK